jgi:hypothetical protein
LFGQEKGPRLLLLRGTSGGHGCQCEAEDNHSGSRDRTFSEAVNHFPRPADISKFSRESASSMPFANEANLRASKRRSTKMFN